MCCHDRIERTRPVYPIRCPYTHTLHHPTFYTTQRTYAHTCVHDAHPAFTRRVFLFEILEQRGFQLFLASPYSMYTCVCGQRDDYIHGPRSAASIPRITQYMRNKKEEMYMISRLATRSGSSWNRSG